MPVSLHANLGAAYQDHSLLPGSKGLLNTVEESMGAVKFMVEEYNRWEDDREYYKLVQVHEAFSQVRRYF